MISTATDDVPLPGRPRSDLPLTPAQIQERWEALPRTGLTRRAYDTLGVDTLVRRLLHDVARLTAALDCAQREAADSWSDARATADENARLRQDLDDVLAGRDVHHDDQRPVSAGRAPELAASVLVTAQREADQVMQEALRVSAAMVGDAETQCGRLFEETRATCDRRLTQAEAETAHIRDRIAAAGKDEAARVWAHHLKTTLDGLIRQISVLREITLGGFLDQAYSLQDAVVASFQDADEAAAEAALHAVSPAAPRPANGRHTTTGHPAGR